MPWVTRRQFQVSLATCLAVVLWIGVLLYLNLVPRVGYENGDPGVVYGAPFPYFKGPPIWEDDAVLVTLKQGLNVFCGLLSAVCLAFAVEFAVRRASPHLDTRPERGRVPSMITASGLTNLNNRNDNAAPRR